MTEATRKKSYNKGLWAETFAALWLMLRGYRILERRYKTKVGEIDIIARKGDTLVFIEVKARGDLSTALESVTPRMRQRIERAALHYLAQYPEVSGLAMRFDVLAVALPFQCRHLDNAWRPST